MKRCKRLRTVGKLTAREPCRCLEATFKQQSNHHANNTGHTRLWAANKGLVGRRSKKPRPEKPATKHCWRQVDSCHVADAPGCHSLRNGLKNCSYLVITGYSSNNDDQAFAESSLFWKISLLKAPNPPIRENLFSIKIRTCAISRMEMGQF